MRVAPNPGTAKVLEYFTFLRRVTRTSFRVAVMRRKSLARAVGLHCPQLRHRYLRRYEEQQGKADAGLALLKKHIFSLERRGGREAERLRHGGHV